MHYYQHHIGDFIKDTSFLTNEEVGIYVKLIWLYYDSEKPLPNDIFTLSMKTNARDVQPIVTGLLDIYFTLQEDGWHHTRCDQTIAEYHKQLDTASKAGKASAEKRKLNASSITVQHESNDRSTTVQPTNNHKPITNNQLTTKPSREIALVVSHDFETFWHTYPKKVGKDAALKSWNKAKPFLDDVLNALYWQKESEQWKRENGKYIPNPSTYLNQGRWKDEAPVEELW